MPATSTTECIMVTAVDEARMAINCLKKGAYDYLVKPISKEDLVSSVNRALERKRLIEILDLGKRRTLPKLINKKAFSPIISSSRAVLRVLKEAELHAASDIPILITGETGTGKELLSGAIHAASSRAGSVFTPVNMESLNTSIFDAQFFGHTRGAFTGADRDSAGYLQSSNRGFTSRTGAFDKNFNFFHAKFNGLFRQQHSGRPTIGTRRVAVDCDFAGCAHVIEP